MTPVPEDDLEQALRRALSAAVSRVEPGADGLERIRARTKKRPPQPWLLAMAGGVLSRARSWVWRGHWIWPDSLPRLHALTWPSFLPWPRLRKLPLPAGGTLATQSQTPASGPLAKWRQILTGPDGANWLRPVGVLAGVAFIASIALAVPPFRSAIVQVSSTVLTGGNSSNGPGSTDGSGTPAGTGTSPGGSQGATGASTSSTGAAAVPGGTSTSGCAQSGTGSSAQSGSGATVASTALLGPTGPGHGVVPSVPPYYSSATPPMCATSTGSPKASPSASPSLSPSPSVSPTSASPTPTDTGSAPPTDTGSPTPTDTGSASASPSSGPSVSPSTSGTGTGSTNSGTNPTNPATSGTPGSGSAS